MPITLEQRELLSNAFRPHAPIEDPSSFVGRTSELDRVREAISSPGLHVVVFGERGCGKTSLANVATSAVPRLQVFCEENANFTTLLRDAALKYQALHPSEVIFDAVSDSIQTRGVRLPASALTGNMFLQLLIPNQALCIVFDELDRVVDRNLIASLAELAKNAATYHPNLTLVMVGANETADGLLAGHLSNFRNLRQVPLTKMSKPELNGILSRGETVLNLSFETKVKEEMIIMSDHMPYYLHLLATNCAKCALNRDSMQVSERDLRNGVQAAAADVDHSLRETYEFAAASQKGSHIYRRLIWAMASMDDVICNAGAINERANQIAAQENDSNVTPQALGAALKRLTSEDKRSIVVQVLAGNYKFKHPLMKGFVRLARHSR